MMVSDRLEAVVVVVGQAIDGDHGAALRRGIVGRLDAADDDVGGALAGDVVEGVLHAAFAEGHQRDDRQRADDDAEHRQDRAQLVQPQAAQGQHEAAPALVRRQQVAQQADDEPTQTGRCHDIAGSWPFTSWVGDASVAMIPIRGQELAAAPGHVSPSSGAAGDRCRCARPISTLAVAHAHHAPGPGGDVVFVRHHDDRLAGPFSSVSSVMISSLVFESRLPVGSSARMTCGSLTRARAMATRCCWPPDSCIGR